MKTTKTMLNNLVKHIADLSGMENNRAAAIANNKTSYLYLDEGYDNYYSLTLICLPNGTHNVPFSLSHHSYKAGEMATMLRGLLGGLTFAHDNGLRFN
jgi:hypothetical protein